MVAVRGCVHLEPFLLVHGLLEREDGVTNEIAHQFEPLPTPLEPEARS